MKKLLTFGLLAALSLPGFAQINWDDVENLISDPGTSVVAVSSTREGNKDDIINGNTATLGWSATPETHKYTNDWVIIDLGSSKPFTHMEIAWRNNHASSYDVYVSNTPFNYSEDKTLSDDEKGDKSGDQLIYRTLTTDLTSLQPAFSGTDDNNDDPYTGVLNNPNGVTGQYLLIYCTNYNGGGNTYGAGIYDVKLANIKEKSVISSFTVSPSILPLGKETEMTFSFGDQNGVPITSGVTVSLKDKDGQATFTNNSLTITSGTYVTLSATYDGNSVDKIIYAATAPSIPAVTSIKTPIYTNPVTENNSTVVWSTGYNGGATNLGEIQFNDGTVATLFGDTRCVFFSNSQTTGEWNGDIYPIENNYSALYLDIFTGSDASGDIEFENVEVAEGQEAAFEGTGYKFTLEAGKWNNIKVDLNNIVKLGNLSVRFNEANKCDILLANIYFSPTAIAGDTEAPVFTKLEAVSETPSTITLTIAATDQNPDIIYGITVGEKQYNTKGTSGEDVTYTIGGLEQDTEYTISVVANDGNQDSAPKTVTCKTQKVEADDVSGLKVEKMVQITEGNSTQVALRAIYTYEIPADEEDGEPIIKEEDFAPSMFSNVTLVASDPEAVTISGGADGVFTVKSDKVGVYKLTATLSKDDYLFVETINLHVNPDWASDKWTDASEGIVPTGRWNSEVADTEHTPAMANDGDLKTYYEFNGGYGGSDAWVLIDLGKVYAIDAIGVYFPASNPATGTFVYAFGDEGAGLPTGNYNWKDDKEELKGWTFTEKYNHVSGGFVTYLPEIVSAARYIAIKDIDCPGGKPQIGEIYVSGKIYSNPVATTVVVNGDLDYIATGESVNLTGYVLDQYNVPVENAPIDYYADGVKLEEPVFTATLVGKASIVAKSGDLTSEPLIINVIADSKNAINKEGSNSTILCESTYNGEGISYNPFTETTEFELGNSLVINFDSPVDLDLLKFNWETACPSEYTVTVTRQLTRAGEGNGETILYVKDRSFTNHNQSDRLYHTTTSDGVVTYLNNGDAVCGVDLGAIKSMTITPIAKGYGADWTIKLLSIDAHGTQEFMDTTGVGNLDDASGNELVDVISLQGVVVKKGVKGAEATANLAPGIYVINGKKVLVK